MSYDLDSKEASAFFTGVGVTLFWGAVIAVGLWLWKHVTLGWIP